MAVEAARGCGFRKIGGLYLVSEKGGSVCGRMPIPLRCCPTCGAGMAPSRGWTWVDPVELFKDAPECRQVSMPLLPQRVREMVQVVACRSCPLASPERLGRRAGLLWIGEQHYKTAAHFELEAATQGISRRIARLPRGFKAGETFVLLAHRKACRDGSEEFPGVFRIFRPLRIELMVPESQRGNELLLKRLEQRGVTPVFLPDEDPDHKGKFTLGKLPTDQGE